MPENERKTSVLLLDSDRISLIYFKAALLNYFSEVHKTENGEKAREVIRHLEKKGEKIDLALIYRSKHEPLGNEILTLIRQNNPKARIIAVTADPFYYKAENATDEGFDNYLLKPISVKNLMAAVFE